ncbi:MAG: hypothetical protein M1839_006585 [Geoglossum umbratile]|nr:MAG: hypothetical protein M1839_006585 [Geoglossum umbratile]
MSAPHDLALFSGLGRDVVVAAMDRYFPKEGRDAVFSDSEIEDISTLLKSMGRPSWATVPRLYVVLRIIGQPDLLDTIIHEKITDFWFPFSEGNISICPGLSTNEFLNAQYIVLTDVTALEKNKHRHLAQGVEMSFKKKGTLGKGSFGVVHRVSSLGQDLARKTIYRGRGLSTELGDMSNFKNEVEALRRLSHRHIVRLEGSYSNVDSAAFFMSPVAGCNLAEYLSEIRDSDEKRTTLRSFFGCLASALAYARGEKVRHKDIKPSNILVLGDRVLLADFGQSRDYSSLPGSATTGVTQTRGSPEYRAQEAAECRQRDSSSDIWSLGCVFLEMSTVLKGKTVADWKTFMKKDSGSPLYWCSQRAISQWIDRLWQTPLKGDNTPLKWVKDMLRDEPASRCKAGDLVVEISSAKSSDGCSIFCGSCCAT